MTIQHKRSLKERILDEMVTKDTKVKFCKKCGKAYVYSHHSHKASSKYYKTIVEHAKKIDFDSLVQYLKNNLGENDLVKSVRDLQMLLVDIK